MTTKRSALQENRESSPDTSQILGALKNFADGANLAQIEAALSLPAPRRTLQLRLQSLVKDGRVATAGRARALKYRLSPAKRKRRTSDERSSYEQQFNLSAESMELRRYLSQPVTERKVSGYNRAFLDAYKPNSTFYLSEKERQILAETGIPGLAGETAGTYARQILQRLLIDLSWNSSRLEGNTYSLLDTRRLIELGQSAPGREGFESQMILNHKDAIEFLVESAAEISFNRYTVLNLHGILAQYLLPEQSAAGRLRHIAVGIAQSTFHPLEAPQLIQECFDQVLDTTAAIRDPFEQALFVMVQLPYLQPFDDVNKRVSRLAANIPFIKRNLSPLSFVDVPRDLYTQAVLGVYELNQVALLKDLFVWAYGRSAAQYAAVRQSLGEPDPFRAKYRADLGRVIAEVLRESMTKSPAVEWIAQFAFEHIAEDDRDMFRQAAEHELMSLHEGNFARFKITPAEFARWQDGWLHDTAIRGLTY